MNLRFFLAGSINCQRNSSCPRSSLPWLPPCLLLPLSLPLRRLRHPLRPLLRPRWHRPLPHRPPPPRPHQKLKKPSTRKLPHRQKLRPRCQPSNRCHSSKPAAGRLFYVRACEKTRAGRGQAGSCFKSQRGELSGQCLQGSCQTALMTSCLVFVDDLLVRDAVDGRHGRLEDCRRSSFVAALDRFANCFDSGAQGRTLGRVVSVLLNCLTSAFARLCGICHGIS